MNEEKQIEQDIHEIEWSDENLEEVAGGTQGSGIGGIDVGIHKKPGGPATPYSGVGS